MFENNLLPFLVAVAPVFLYMFMILGFIPKGYIVPRRANRYFVVGLLSTTLITIIHYIFPNINVINHGILFFCIFQIGFWEELSKYIAYHWTTSQRKSSYEDLPIATMYYVMLCAAGFAIIENIEYSIVYGGNIGFLRATTAIVLHMVCGVIMGYYVAKAKNLTTSYFVPTSHFHFFVKDYTSIAKFLYVCFGLMMAALLHGMYDYNLSLAMNVYAEFMMWMFILGGLAIAFFMIKDLLRDSNEIKAKRDVITAPKKLPKKRKHI
jgi:RsiW-degrading membrane proteinase PrsW (M82 family)